MPAVRSFLPGFHLPGRWLAAALCLTLSALASNALAREGLSVGILSSRNPEVMAQRFTPLVEHLAQELDRPVTLEVLTQDSMAQALREQKLDLVMTNPSHFLVLRADHALTGVLATLVSGDQDGEINAVGGVIFTRASRTDLSDLPQLSHRRIAAAGQQFLGGYQAQAFELLNAGVSPDDVDMHWVGNHDRVVDAVLNGMVDAGFVRTGEIEHMVRQGHLKRDAIRIVHSMQHPGFPFLVSTRLYPEWPVLALPHVDPHIARKVASTLLGMAATHPAMQAAGLHAFGIPADYLPVETLARALRAPPYDHPPQFTLADVLAEYRASAAIIGTLVLVLTVLLWVLVLQRLRLVRALRGTQLGASVFRHAQEGILITDPQGQIVDVNPSFTRITGYPRDEVLGRAPSLLGSGRHGKAFYQQMWQALETTGRWHGEIWNRRKSGEVYAEVLTITAIRDAKGGLQNHMAVFSDITAQKEHQKQLELIAHYDVLTGLPNRSLLADRLQQALAQAQRRQTLLALVFLDLDGFKLINDTLGHEAGDQLLQELGQRMKDVLREGDTLARVGGDEFVAVLTDLAGTGDCERVLRRLLEAASTPVPRGDTALQASASLGVALFPQDATDADLLLRHADQAMYQAKQLGKNRYHFFDTGEDDDARHRREQVDQVAQALAAGQFELYYQPKVNMRRGKVLGAEALIRWNHPDGTVRGPATFLPGIEGHPMSATVGRWVMQTAMRQMVDWSGQGLALPLSVNVSAYHLQQKDFVEQVRALLLTHPQLPPQSLQLEVLETSALQDMAWVADVIHACTQMGVGFALDDFGTGYSSLTYLKRLPAQVLKIDQSFVRDMLSDTEDLTIVEGVISLAQAFGRTVVAEGVETHEHGAMLLRLGCDQAQGYGVARPMPAQALAQWAREWRPPATWTDQLHRVPNRRDLPFVLAEVEHKDWVERIKSHVLGGQDAAPPLEASTCQFSRTLANLVASGTLAPSPQLDALMAQHDEVHALGAQLVHGRAQCHEAGLHDAQMALDRASERLLELLHSFQR